MATEDRPVILVTGSTDGIGKLAARRLAEEGAAVLVHGRSPEKVQGAAAEIHEAGGHRDVIPFTADLASLAAVRRLAGEVQDRVHRLDVLINNAGVLPTGGDDGERPLSEDGHELCLAVNYLAPFLLTHLLMPLLRNAPAARVLNVSSAAQEIVDLDDLELERSPYTPMRAYARSKLALAMFTMELSDRIDTDRMTVNCLHPGTLLDTKMVRQSFSRTLDSAESGADVEVYLATSPDVAGVSGAYFDRKSRSRAHQQAYDREARDRLWRRTLELTGLGTHRG